MSPRGHRRPVLPCRNLTGPWGCRCWASLHWWSWAGLDWDDYLWVEYFQYGARP